jgi:hypothetical protein
LARSLPGRPPAACAFDLLVLGILWREHGGDSVRLSHTGKYILRRMLEIQDRLPMCEAGIKTLRGLIYRIGRKQGKETTNDQLDDLVDWLKATGENTIAMRLEEWRLYFQACGGIEPFRDRIVQLAEVFSSTSLQQLGKYTDRVEKYLRDEARKHKWRYDASLLNRTRTEYHLAMLGNEILNRTYRSAFCERKVKIVILPPCMRAEGDGRCKAVPTRMGQRCAGCMPGCRVHQITLMGEKKGFQVFMIPDELRVFGAGREEENTPGVVGVSCLLTNWSGGWDLERLGISGQGVLLDFVGCSYHWDKAGFPTDLNLHRLLACLQDDQIPDKRGKPDSSLFIVQ